MGFLSLQTMIGETGAYGRVARTQMQKLHQHKVLRTGMWLADQSLMRKLQSTCFARLEQDSPRYYSSLVVNVCMCFHLSAIDSLFEIIHRRVWTILQDFAVVLASCPDHLRMQKCKIFKINVGMDVDMIISIFKYDHPNIQEKS